MTSEIKNKEELEGLKFNLEQSLEQGIDFKNRSIRITGQIGQPSGFGGDVEYFDFNLLDYALTQMEVDSDNDITIKIHTPGGEMFDALAIVGRMKRSPCKIVTEAFGHCMSAGTLILMAGDLRRLSKYCVTMFHEIGYGVQGQHEDIKEQVAQSDKELKRWAKYYEDFSSKKASFWLSKMKKREYYPTPEQMLEFDAIDEII